MSNYLPDSQNFLIINEIEVKNVIVIYIYFPKIL